MCDVEVAFHEAYGRAVATLVRVFGDISLAEDAVQDAFVRALQTWPRDGAPSSPAAWIITTARNRATDVVRREARGRELSAQRAAEETRGGHSPDIDMSASRLKDDQLSLIFTCCHPALRVEHQVALTLRLVAGLTPAEVARAFLVNEATVAKRVVRAKHKIKAGNIAYRVPEDPELPARVRSVLTVVYLVYNAGADDPRDRSRLRREAIRLARALVALMPDEVEVSGLLALLLLSESRAAARWVDGRIVPLQDQDRSTWDLDLISEGQQLVLEGLRHPTPGPFLLQAAIHSIHSAAPQPGDTDWAAILRFYDRLLLRTPTPVVVMNRAIVVGEVEGPLAALQQLEGVAEQLDRHHLLHATRAVMLERIGDVEATKAAYARALDLAPTTAQKALLEERRLSAEVIWSRLEPL